MMLIVRMFVIHLDMSNLHVLRNICICICVRRWKFPFGPSGEKWRTIININRKVHHFWSKLYLHIKQSKEKCLATAGLLHQEWHELWKLPTVKFFMFSVSVHLSRLRNWHCKVIAFPIVHYRGRQHSYNLVFFNHPILISYIFGYKYCSFAITLV